MTPDTQLAAAPPQQLLKTAIPRYYESLDFPALWDEFPTAPDYFESTYRLPPEGIAALQEKRLLQQVARGWQIPFYQRHWGAGGLKPGDVSCLADLKEIPPFSVHDLRESIERNPPWGDFLGIDPTRDAPMPLVLQTSGGTTGLPRAMLYTPRDREVMNIITGRRLFMQGVRPYDLVQVALSTGLTNGGFLAREGIWKYTGAVPVMTGSGAQTPTRRQVEILKAWNVNFLVGFSAYLRNIGLVARDDMGIDPRSLGLRGLIAHLGMEDREALEDLWGCGVYDTYGTNEFGSIASDCVHRTGMHVFEDAMHVEIVDPETGQARDKGERGVMYVTSLFKHAAPMIRFNSNDISSWVEGAPCACGSHHRRLTKLFGRADNMVKLRGTNIFPEAVGALVAEHPATNGEYVCILERDAATGREDMRVRFELKDANHPATQVEQDLTLRIKEALGVKLVLQAAAPGELSPLTGLSSTSKIKRLIDARTKA
ncbi:phenylacetate--CoA ligase family protein [Polaromonas eurypsychrophila]|uniref:Phenylacetate-coenzyme A ligase n=1 Tax=Polaromonas eurypsychrophila TaxID=1614635 RepID=A0A916SFU7_9BURK|nr:phenylacetate--CoA ligase family protein [Polaromonas eurypsychrophila]GGA98144.1 phenylacetate-coenzyme A ligase [Polaromonas eurypsychrophila]